MSLKEIVEKIIKINRCTTVTKGGRKFGFSVLLVIGDKKGRCGYGFGKGVEIAEAKNKALHKAKKNIFKIPLKEKRTLYHNIKGCFCSSLIIMKPARSGTGVIAGGITRALFEVLGIQDIIAKSIGSRNPNNLLKATIKGLKNISTPKMISMKRYKK